MTRVRNDRFDARRGLNRGRPGWVEAAWYLAKCALFLTALPVPSAVKRAVLRMFGATVGEGVVIKPRVNIHFPWRLTIGDHAWIGEEVFILNFEQVFVGAHACVSQRVFLCAGNHDFRDVAMGYRNAPIRLEDGVWVGAQSFVGPGVTLGVDSVISAGSVVTRSQAAGTVSGGNPCVRLGMRWKD